MLLSHERSQERGKSEEIRDFGDGWGMINRSFHDSYDHLLERIRLLEKE